MLRVNLARVHAEHGAVGARENRERQREELHAESRSGGHRFGLANQHRIVELHLVGKRVYGLQAIDGDTHHLKRGIAGLKFLQHRNFPAARRAPGRPEVDEQRFAGPAPDRAPVAAEVWKRKLGQAVRECFSGRRGLCGRLLDGSGREKPETGIGEQRRNAQRERQSGRS